MKILLMFIGIILCILIYKDLNHKIRYEDDPKTKHKWFDIGYKSGIEEGKTMGYLMTLNNLGKLCGETK